MPGVLTFNSDSTSITFSGVYTLTHLGLEKCWIAQGIFGLGEFPSLSSLVLTLWGLWTSEISKSSTLGTYHCYQRNNPLVTDLNCIQAHRYHYYFRNHLFHLLKCLIWSEPKSPSISTKYNTQTNSITKQRLLLYEHCSRQSIRFYSIEYTKVGISWFWMMKYWFQM